MFQERILLFCLLKLIGFAGKELCNVKKQRQVIFPPFFSFGRGEFVRFYGHFKPQSPWGRGILDILTFHSAKPGHMPYMVVTFLMSNPRLMSILPISVSNPIVKSYSDQE